MNGPPLFNEAESMALREVTDAKGIVWSIWAVRPTLGERNAGSRDARPHAIRQERMQTPVDVSRLPAQVANGWLAMRSEGERRRLVPIPDGWEEMSDEELRRCIAEASPVATPSSMHD